MIKRIRPSEYLEGPKEEKQTEVIRKSVLQTNQNRRWMMLLAGMFCVTVISISAMYFYKK